MPRPPWIGGLRCLFWGKGEPEGQPQPVGSIALALLPVSLLLWIQRKPIVPDPMNPFTPQNLAFPTTLGTGMERPLNP